MTFSLKEKKNSFLKEEREIFCLFSCLSSISKQLVSVWCSLLFILMSLWFNVLVLISHKWIMIWWFAVSCSALCLTLRNFWFKTRYYFTIILFSSSLWYLLKRLPVKAFISGLSHSAQLFSIPARCALYSFTDTGCPCKLLSSFSPSKTPTETNPFCFFNPQEMPEYFTFESLWARSL